MLVGGVVLHFVAISASLGTRMAYIMAGRHHAVIYAILGSNSGVLTLFDGFDGVFMFLDGFDGVLLGSCFLMVF